MLKKIVLWTFALVALALICTYVLYRLDAAERFQTLSDSSLIVETAVGPIEYSFDDGAEPVMLFLHGTPGGYDQDVDAPGMRVLTPSRPGYLRTPLSVGASPKEQADAMAALLDALHLERVVVMGASGGGPAAISFAQRYPQRTRGLIAMEAVSQELLLADGQEPPAFMQSDFMLWTVLSLTQRFMGAEGIAKMMIPDPKNQELLLADADSTAKVGGLFWSLWPASGRQAGFDNDTQQFAQLDLTKAIVNVPTLIVHGTEDTNVPLAHSTALAKQIPHAQLHLIEGADHMMPFSHAAEVGAVTATFIRSLESVR